MAANPDADESHPNLLVGAQRAYHRRSRQLGQADAAQTHCSCRPSRLLKKFHPREWNIHKVFPCQLRESVRGLQPIPGWLPAQPIVSPSQWSDKPLQPASPAHGWVLLLARKTVPRKAVPRRAIGGYSFRTLGRVPVLNRELHLASSRVAPP